MLSNSLEILRYQATMLGRLSISLYRMQPCNELPNIGLPSCHMTLRIFSVDRSDDGPDYERTLESGDDNQRLKDIVHYAFKTFRLVLCWHMSYFYLLCDITNKNSPFFWISVSMRIGS